MVEATAAVDLWTAGRARSRPLDERVAKGAALLDLLAPGWHRAVDPDRLDMADSERCVLGQLCHCYSLGRVALLHDAPAWAFGFHRLLPEDGGEDDSDLAWRWRAEIDRRREADGAGIGYASALDEMATAIARDWPHRSTILREAAAMIRKARGRGEVFLG